MILAGRSREGNKLYIAISNYISNVSNFKINGMCSKIISLVWSDTADCCLSYDEVYGYGGSENFRKETDYRFKKCALEHGMKEKSATVLYYVTRVLGSPYVDTSWRWGYAYDFGAGYEANR